MAKRKPYQKDRRNELHNLYEVLSAAYPKGWAGDGPAWQIDHFRCRHAQVAVTVEGCHPQLPNDWELVVAISSDLPLAARDAGLAIRRSRERDMYSSSAAPAAMARARRAMAKITHAQLALVPATQENICPTCRLELSRSGECECA